MNILYIGDIMGEMGIEVVREVLPELKSKKQIDLVIAQGENVTSGRGINEQDYLRLKSIGVDFFTGGNWSLSQPDIIGLLNDRNAPIIRPANYDSSTPGLGYKYINKVLVISLLGQIVGKDSNTLLDNPLKTIDNILKSEAAAEKVATIVNIHGDYSSEKVVIGYYLDGQVSAVIGDHWHVPTADAMVLPKGTAHITDVGMCGSLDSSLGVSFSSIIPRWRDGVKTRNVLEETGRKQFNAVIVSVDDSGLASSIEQIRHIIN
jgi:metallophosphoesterase (TIGR00282 family)